MAEEIPLLAQFSPPPELARGRTLRSWKEIAQYMNRGIRTVQRWEKFLKLPVHRREPKAEVFALSSEVDAWFQSFAKNPPVPVDGGPEHWRDVAEQASQEEDPERLLKLINELNHLLSKNDSRSERNRGRHPTPGHPKEA